MTATEKFAYADKTISDGKRIFERFVQENQEIFDAQNEIAKAWFLDPQNIDCIAKAITMYIFRDGPVEDSHNSKERLTDAAMKEINIYMMNHLAGLLTYAIEGNWLQLRALTAYYSTFNKEWYPAVAATQTIDYLFFNEVKPKRK